MKEAINRKIALYQKQYKLHGMMVQRADAANNDHSLGVKDICGYDGRIAMNEAEFELWCATTEATTALETGILGPRTAETKHIAAVLPAPGQAVPDESDVKDGLKSMCLRARKKCTRHSDWRHTHSADLRFQIKLLVESAKGLGEREREIVGDAETREAIKSLYAENTVEQLF